VVTHCGGGGTSREGLFGGAGSEGVASTTESLPKGW
jgi:hypothetical protein